MRLKMWPKYAKNMCIQTETIESLFLMIRIDF
jgi:hypothetical protein